MQKERNLIMMLWHFIAKAYKSAFSWLQQYKVLEISIVEKAFKKYI